MGSDYWLSKIFRILTWLSKIFRILHWLSKKRNQPQNHTFPSQWVAIFPSESPLRSQQQLQEPWKLHGLPWHDMPWQPTCAQWDKTYGGLPDSSWLVTMVSWELLSHGHHGFSQDNDSILAGSPWTNPVSLESWPCDAYHLLTGQLYQHSDGKHKPSVFSIAPCNMFTFDTALTLSCCNLYSYIEQYTSLFSGSEHHSNGPKSLSKLFLSHLTNEWYPTAVLFPCHGQCIAQ